MTQVQKLLPIPLASLLWEQQCDATHGKARPGQEASAVGAQLVTGAGGGAPVAVGSGASRACAHGTGLFSLQGAGHQRYGSDVGSHGGSPAPWRTHAFLLPLCGQHQRPLGLAGGPRQLDCSCPLLSLGEKEKLSLQPQSTIGFLHSDWTHPGRLSLWAQKQMPGEWHMLIGLRIRCLPASGMNRRGEAEPQLCW